MDKKFFGRFYIRTKDGSFVDLPLTTEQMAYFNKKHSENPERYQYAEGVILAINEMREEMKEKEMNGNGNEYEN